MTVTATPVPAPVTSSSSCADQSTLRPDVTTLYDIPIPAKRRAAVARQNQTATLEVILFDRVGNPIDLTACGLVNDTVTTPLARARFREATNIFDDQFEKEGIVLDAANGKVSFSLTSTVMDAPGIYMVEVGVLNSSGSLLYSDVFDLIVERGLFGVVADSAAEGGMPTVQEIRTAVRDFPETNRLLDNYQWDLADIAQAITQSVVEWNVSQPPIPLTYDTTSFPRQWRYHWIEGIKCYLYQIAANWHAANKLPYEAAGIRVDDVGKIQEYLTLAAASQKTWTDWVRRTRAAINMSMCWGSVGSGYAC